MSIIPALRRAGPRLVPVLLILVLSARLAAEEVVVDFGAAILETWVQPAYPEAARKAKQEGRVVVEFVVEADGTVTRETVSDSSAPVFDQAALAAVRQWHFKPALEDAKPAASAMKAPVVFRLQQLRQKQAPMMPEYENMPAPLPVTPAHAEGSINPEYPAELDDLRLPGLVRIRFTVEPEGTARQPQVLFASHPAFVESALRTLEAAKFSPARQGPLVHPATLEYPVAFESFGAKPGDILAANQLEMVGAAAGLPLPVMLIQPVYPHERLLAGESATVTAEFTVNADGQTEDVAVVNPAGGDFEEAMRAAVESWVFKPARGDQGPVAVRVRVTHAFTPTAADARLAELLKPGGSGVAGASGLDQKLKPLWRGFPIYPKSLIQDKPDGRAVIEFVIDRDGRARALKIVEASAPEFGWAAATAISQWVFERPRRSGQPADVKVRVPVDFKPPHA